MNEVKFFFRAGLALIVLPVAFGVITNTELGGLVLLAVMYVGPFFLLLAFIYAVLDGFENIIGNGVRRAQDPCTHLCTPKMHRHFR